MTFISSIVGQLLGLGHLLTISGINSHKASFPGLPANMRIVSDVIVSHSDR